LGFAFLAVLLDTFLAPKGVAQDAWLKTGTINAGDVGRRGIRPYYEKKEGRVKGRASINWFDLGKHSPWAEKGAV